eukprot:COSAG02_NODE_8067_length_2722_cov_2.277545_3_plen_80_part_00
MVWGKADWALGLTGREGALAYLAPIVPQIFVSVRFDSACVNSYTCGSQVLLPIFLPLVTSLSSLPCNQQLWNGCTISTR